MGEKISTIVLKVDLECQRCYKKIRKVLCKIQDKMEIKSISYDEKSNSVTISGPFDADKVCRKLCCHAGRVIKDMSIKGKDGGEKAAAKPAEKDAGKQEKAAKEGKGGAEKPAEKKEAKSAEKAEKEAKPDKAEKEAKPAEKEGKQDKKKVTFQQDAPKADIGPLLEKMKAAVEAANKAPTSSPEPPRGEPIAPVPVPAAQGVAVHSIWPAPASSVAGYGYSPSSYYNGGYGGGYYGGCNCGYAGVYCRCGKQPPGGGYYGVPVYDNQGWYYGGGGRQQYYPQQQQSYYEDPNAGCSVM